MRRTGAGVYIDVHEDSEYRADNSAYGLPNSGLRAFGGVNFSSSPELRELPTFGATQPFIRAVVLCRYV